MKTKHLWGFRSRFRRGTFGWRGSSKAIERIDEALSEILLVTRTDPALGAEGAVILLTKISPALQDVDSSSGSLGNASYRMVETLVPIIAQAPASELTFKCAGRVGSASLSHAFALGKHPGRC